MFDVFRQFRKISYEKLYQRSEIRANLLSWLQLPKNSSILVVNEEKTRLVEALKEKAAKVTFIKEADLSEKLTDSYDVIIHIGEMDCKRNQMAGAEVASNAINAYTELFSEYRAHLNPQGILVAAVGNRLGLKYFAGCQDDNHNQYFAGPEGYERSKADATQKENRQALSKKEYECALLNAGFSNTQIYYPYPDYKFPIAIYSDEWLPGEGELNANIRNFDKDRYVLFDETNVFNSFIKEGLFSEFSNSFLFLCNAGSEGKEDMNTESGMKLLYSKFSNERAKQFQIRTDILKDSSGERYVVKYPLSSKAALHVENMVSAYEKLSKNNQAENIVFCPAELVSMNSESKNSKGARSPFVKGTSLQNIITTYIETNQIEKAKETILDFIERYRDYAKKQKIAGMPQGQTDAGVITNLDFIFPNILVDGETWNIIDYEWSFEKEVPADFIIYRALFRASIELPKCELTKLPNLLKLAGISKEQAKQYREWEETFQQFISGDEIPIRDMVWHIGNQVTPFAGNQSEIDAVVEKNVNLHAKDTLDIYYHIDRQENQQGKAFVSGWACALIGKKKYMPVLIHIYDEEGQNVALDLNRTSRLDVKQALEGKEADPAYWGFDLSFSAGSRNKFTIRFSTGCFMKEETLTALKKAKVSEEEK